MKSRKTLRINCGRLAEYRRVFVLFVGLALGFCPSMLPAQSVTFSWTPTSSEAVGYLICQSSDGTNFNPLVDVGDSTSYTVDGLQPGYSSYFEVVAYDSDQNESPPSNQIEYTVPTTVQTETVTLLTDPADAGTATGGGTYSAGAFLTVTALPASGYTFSSWTENGIVQSTSPNYSFTLTANCSLVANFAANPGVYTVVAQSTPANAGNVAGSGNYVAGTTVTVTATADNGYTFSYWTESGSVRSISPNYSFTVTANCNLVANYAANQVQYTVAAQSNPANAGNVTGGGNYVAGTTVTMKATASSGYAFKNWTENGVVQSVWPSYALTVATNRNLVANFTVTYTVAAQSNPANAGNVTGGGNYVTGTLMSVSAIAKPGYVFSSWMENGIVQSLWANYAFTLSANRNLVAVFTTNPITYAVVTQSNPANGGNVAGAGAYPSGTFLTVTALASNDCTFSNWTEDGIVQSTSPNYSFVLLSNLNLVANFTINAGAWTVTSSTGMNGSVSPNGPEAVLTGSNIAFTAAPASGYQVNQWLVNGTAAQNGGSSYVLQNVRSNMFVGVTFSAKPTVIATSAGTTPGQSNAPPSFILLVSGNGTLAPNPKGKVFQIGKKYTLTASPAKGWVFAGWLDNNVVVGTAPKYTFTVESNMVLQADFVPNAFLPLAGTYHGLFGVSNDAAEASSGSFAATITSAGAFSAKIVLTGQSHSFSGEFSSTGAALKSIARPGLSPITVHLQLGLTDGSFTGTVSDGTWTANLLAAPALYSKTNPAPQAGQYTLIIPPGANPSPQPGGNSFGTVTVQPSGNVTFAGMLGDGTAVTSAGVVCGQGQWPFYVSLYGGKGSIQGWLAFTNNGGISGQTSWFKPPQATAKLYPGGFTQSTNVIGSTYTYSTGLPILNFIDGVLVLANGGLAQSLTNQLVLSPGALATAQSVAGHSSWKLIFKPSSGLFKGSGLNPETGAPITVNGVVLRNQNIAAGSFIGTSGTGSVLLYPAR